MKKLFIAEIEKITDERLRELCLDMVNDVPDYFWTVAASSSGKYHPACDLGEGGLVRHSIMVCHIALDLIDSEIFVKNTPIIRDCAIVAALFHDILKHGLVDENGKYSDKTVFEHPNLSADFVLQHLKNKYTYVYVSEIYSGIKSHMGRWNTSKYSKEVLSTPQTNFQKLIHTADFIASRKYIGGLKEWNNL